MNLNEAYKLAGRNAAGLIESMDLEQLFGGDSEVDGKEELFDKAQRKLVKFMHAHFSEKSCGREKGGL